MKIRDVEAVQKASEQYEEYVRRAVDAQDTVWLHVRGKDDATPEEERHFAKRSEYVQTLVGLGYDKHHAEHEARSLEQRELRRAETRQKVERQLQTRKLAARRQWLDAGFAPDEFDAHWAEQERRLKLEMLTEKADPAIGRIDF